MHHLWPFFIYVMVAAAALMASTISGSWQRVSDGRMLVFRSPWTQTVGGTMIAALMFMACSFPVSQADPPGLFLLLAWFVITGGPGLLLLVLCSPEELQIDRQDKTYRYTRLWLTPWRKGNARPLTDFSGVCIPTTGLLLVFRKKRGLLYGCVLGRFANRDQAQEQASKFADMTGLPIVEAPWRKGRGFVA